ncbi:MAG: hypothetical protein C4576_28310 [Desulfobacteraceae bacterium]|nr:MAG: hypothetical protein C4576_28310 [Desulfobacteraceae bacterium]
MAAVEKERDREDKLELIESMIRNLRECMAGADLIISMDDNVPIEDVEQALVITAAMSNVAHRIEQNALCTLQEILIEYQDYEELKEYGYILEQKCRFLPQNSHHRPKEDKAGHLSEKELVERFVHMAKNQEQYPQYPELCRLIREGVEEIRKMEAGQGVQS